MAPQLSSRTAGAHYRACVCACVRACVRACLSMRVCVGWCPSVRLCVCASVLRVFECAHVPFACSHMHLRNLYLLGFIDDIVLFNRWA